MEDIGRVLTKIFMPIGLMAVVFLVLALILGGNILAASIFVVVSGGLWWIGDVMTKKGH